MITFAAVCLKHHRNRDGTYPVKIRITFKRKSRWIPTNVAAYPEQLTRNLHIKDNQLNNRINDLIASFRESASKINIFALDEMDIDKVVQFIRQDQRVRSFELDFFCYADKFIRTKKPQTAEVYSSAVSKFKIFLNSDKLDCNDITVAMLRDFVEWDKTKIAAGHLGKLASIYNAARDEFNDEESGVIVLPRNPFSKVSAPKMMFVGQRSRSHDIMQMIISENDAELTRRERMALDLFVVSFVLMGANLADLFDAAPPVNGVWIYERKKTRSRRADNARIEVVVPDCIRPYIDRLHPGVRRRGKWLGFGVINNCQSLCWTVNEGLADYSRRRGLDKFTFYSARKTFATIARKAGVEKATIDECLNHIGDYKQADIYIEKDFAIINSARDVVLSQFTW